MKKVYEVDLDFVLECYQAAGERWRKRLREQFEDLFPEKIINHNFTGWAYCFQDLVMEYSKEVDAVKGKLYWMSDGEFKDERGMSHLVGHANMWFREATLEEINNPFIDRNYEFEKV